MTLDARLIAALRAAPVHLLAGDLASALGASLLEIESGLARLRAAAFDIETKPGFGCRLLGSPDRLIADDLYARLGGCALAREIVVFAETSSTNDIAAKLGREGHAGAVVFAERQTAGRGRFGRRWDSADHAGLWFSLLLRPALPQSQWPRLTTWAGVAIASAVERALSPGTAAMIKWPNDVLVCGKKIAGILIESASDDAGAPFAVVGIGINVNQPAFPPELAGTAASLRQVAGRELDRPALAADVLRELDARIPALTGDFSGLIAEASRRSELLGGWVRLSGIGTGSIVEGTAESLDAEGNLRLRVADGTLRVIGAGEVTSQIPASVPAR